MKIADLSVDRPVLISMIMVALILLGLVALPLLPVDLYPSLDIPVAMVSTSWSGSTPSVVEEQVTKPVEAVMSTVSNVNEVDSISRNGQSMVIVRFNYGTNMDQAVADMRDKINQVSGRLPSDAGAPMIMRIDPNSMPIMTLALAGKDASVEQLKQLADDVVTPRLQQVGGVSAVNVNGGKTRQIQVLVDPSRLQNYGLSITQVIQALQSDNMQGDAGLVNKGNQEIDLHVNGQFITPGDVLNVPVRLPSGGTIKISDLAQVNDAYADVTELARVNGLPCVSLDVMKMSGGNTVQVSGNVQKVIPDINRVLPPGVKLTVISDQAKYIRQSIDTVINHTLLGGLFALVVLWLFLRRVRTTAVIAIVIPIAMISTFAALYFAGQTINTISLGGLALGMGSLVDFAVVVIESIFRYRESGCGAEEAAKQGTAEVGTAVMASALSQISVFAPIVFVQGFASQIFMPMALAVVFSHLAALVGALTLVPMLAAKLMRGKSFSVDLTGGSRWNPSAVFTRGVEKLKSHYERFLRWALSHRKTVLAATVLMLAGSLALIPVVGFELMPNQDQGQYSVGISMAQGTKLAVTNQVAGQIEQLIRHMPETDTVYTVVGSPGGNFISSQSATNTASINVTLKPLSERKRSVFQIIEELRNKTALIPGAQINIQAAQQGFGRSGAAIQVVLQGSDLNVLRELGDLVAGQIEQVPGTRSVLNTMDKTNPEYDVTIDRVRAAQYGITVQQILNTLRADYNGTKATSYNAGSTSVDVVVKLPEDYTRNYSHLNDITVVSPSGAQVPITALATVKPAAGPAVIRRQNQMRQVTVQADVFGRSVGQVQRDIQTRLDQLNLPAGYSWQFGGQAKDMASSFKSLGLAMPLAIVLMYMVMAGQFESLFSPFIIMFSLPPTFVGVMLGLLIMHHAVSVNALIGVIMLIGIVVNNAIVLVDYTNQLRRKGLSAREALCQAGPVRLRPILMTTCTTVLAMFPLMLGYGEGAEAQAPMGTVVVFGLTVSTLVTLVLVPVMYTVIGDLGVRWRDFWRKRQETGRMAG
ncbi:efflux RND transporter permease subunit [Desulfotomaculum copahuensis]|uniref:Multidrug ABC transporter n=1 Tax=Desulfotomaculum copahuensis TaxID=1838280 RepID=A0A1B7LCR3_9FIRM|nr:efflux RND transporter permease subunit [Desulfotomaculum copahuensis]OAT80718.1 multidrug ABC transporter [Desulfotomaculum copahuensis]